MQSFTKDLQNSADAALPENNSARTILHYAWVPRSEVVYLQAVVDAYEGLTRIRTERHDKNRSLLMFMVPASRLPEFHDFLRHIKNEIFGSIESI
jgi:hypothetical protein